VERWEGGRGQGSGTVSPARSLARRQSGGTTRRVAASQEVRGKGASEMASASGWDAGP
jgi:hypothetical protein